jgi:4-amino-4-deoxy-L-arabinose transferase-like glycosyltransferase
MQIRDNEILLIWLIIGLGIGLRLAAIFGLGHVPESDEKAYQSIAVSLIEGRGILDIFGNRAFYNVGYPLFVLAPVYLIFGQHLIVAQLANLTLSAGSIFLCYQVARKAGAGPYGSLLAMTMWAFYLPASIYTAYLAKEDLMIPLMLGVMWCVLSLAINPSIKIAAFCGLLFGLLALVGNAGLSLVGAALLGLLLAPVSLSKRFMLGIVIVLIATSVTVPWLIRNDRVVGAPVLNTNGGFNLYLGNNPAATGWFISIADTPRGQTWNAMRDQSELNATETLKREAVNWVRVHPEKFLSLALRKAIYFWLPPVHKIDSKSSFSEMSVRGAWVLEFIVVVVAALAGLTQRELRNSQTAILWAAIGCYTAVHMLFYVIFRYREPIMPLMVVMSALAVESFTRKRKSPLFCTSLGTGHESNRNGS